MVPDLSFLILSKNRNQQKNEKKSNDLVFFCFFFTYFVPVKTKEPEAVSTDVGIVFLLIAFPFKHALCIYFQLIYSDRTMKVQVNNKEVEIAPDSTLTQLTAQLELPVQGIAIAVNNKMIPRTEWEGFILHENDNLVIIKAACGG